MRLLLALTLVTTVAGCHQTGRPDPETPLIKPEEAKPETSPAPTPPPVPLPPTSLKGEAGLRRSGTLARGELDQFLDAAPGAFLQRVEPEPRFVQGRFAGWRIKAFFPGDARFASVDLQAGDVVTRVNGKLLERPEHLMDMWQALRSSRELVVDVERGGKAHTLRWTISD
jgi:S1-C subfamily serine protease